METVRKTRVSDILKNKSKIKKLLEKNGNWSEENNQTLIKYVEVAWSRKKINLFTHLGGDGYLNTQ